MLQESCAGQTSTGRYGGVRQVRVERELSPETPEKQMRGEERAEERHGGTEELTKQK